MKIGFTGTHKGMPTIQAAKVIHYLKKYRDLESSSRPQFHSGDCVGADEQAFEIARQQGYYLVGHPPTNDKSRAFKHYDLTYVYKPYLVRNKAIVDETDELIAAPAQIVEQIRSGTWSTIRYARKQHKPITLIFPDGSVRQEFNET